MSAQLRTETWREWLAPDASTDVTVAENGSAVVAFIAVGAGWDDDAGPGTGEVAAIYAREHAWGTGVGRQLMERGLRQLADRGFTEATLWVLETNERARRFYEAGGWVLDDRSKRAEIGGTVVTEVRYRRSLSG